MAYVTDNELGPGGHYETAASWRKDFVAFLGGVELLIHDAMYTPEELEEHRGWGHSTFEEAVALAGDAGVKRDRKSTRLNSSHTVISYAVFCLKKKNNR